MTDLLDLSGELDEVKLVLLADLVGVHQLVTIRTGIALHKVHWKLNFQRISLTALTAGPKLSKVVLAPMQRHLLQGQ